LERDMFMQPRYPRLLALLIGMFVCAAPLVAQAQRKSPLADAPAIRKRLELRSTRLELGAGAGSTLNQDFYHSVFINVKLGFHFTDWFAISAFGGFAVANLATGFQDRIVDSLNKDNMPVPRQPSGDVAKGSMNKITQMLGAQLEFTPFTGKYSMFGKIFAHYDFYAFVGPGFLNLTATDPNMAACTDGGMGRECAVTGLKLGGNVGVGLHSYINQFIALNLELRDIVVQNNPSGRDVNGDTRANLADVGWQSTFAASLNVVIYLPSTADISN
jgi:outer membrane beta-barrel protein